MSNYFSRECEGLPGAFAFNLQRSNLFSKEDRERGNKGHCPRRDPRLVFFSSVLTSAIPSFSRLNSVWSENRLWNLWLWLAKYFRIMKLQTKNRKVSSTDFKKDFLFFFFFELPLATTDSFRTPAFWQSFANGFPHIFTTIWAIVRIRIRERITRILLAVHLILPSKLGSDSSNLIFLPTEGIFTKISEKKIEDCASHEGNTFKNLDTP